MQTDFKEAQSSGDIKLMINIFDDLVESENLIGKTEHEVIQFIGPPDEITDVYSEGYSSGYKCPSKTDEILWLHYRFSDNNGPVQLESSGMCLK